jgi:hypothetical protein
MATEGEVDGSQRVRPLERANRVRMTRSRVKAHIAAGELAAAEVILSARPEIERMPIAEVLGERKQLRKISPWGCATSASAIADSSRPAPASTVPYRQNLSSGRHLRVAAVRAAPPHLPRDPSAAITAPSRQAAVTFPSG